MTYPCMLYHPQSGAVIVQDEAEHAALSPLWTRTPPEDSISVSPTVIRLDAVPAEPAEIPEPPPEAILVAELPEKRKPGRPKKAD